MNTELLKQLRDYVRSNHQSENTRRNYIDNPTRINTSNTAMKNTNEIPSPSNSGSSKTS